MNEISADLKRNFGQDQTSDFKLKYENKLMLFELLLTPEHFNS